MTRELVVDASALVLALVGKGDDAAALRERLRGVRGHAPHLVDAELGSVLRGHEQAGLLVADEAAAALQAGRWLIEHRYPHAGPLAEHAWSLRNNLSFYDALYVALASRLGIGLLTADVRMAQAPGVTCTVEIIETGENRPP